MNEFDATGGASGSWISDIVGKYFDYRAKTSSTPGVQWAPYGPGGAQFGIAPDGSLIQRGTPAAVASPLAGLAPFLPLLLLAGLAFLAYRALK